MNTAALQIAVAAIVLSLNACSTPDKVESTSATSSVAVGSIIAKPKVAVADGTALIKQIREKLAHPERVELLRPMSGGAYVLNVVSPATKNDIPTVIADLEATGLFDYVEADQIMTIQK